MLVISILPPHEVTAIPAIPGLLQNCRDFRGSSIIWFGGNPCMFSCSLALAAPTDAPPPFFFASKMMGNVMNAKVLSTIHPLSAGASGGPSHEKTCDAHTTFTSHNYVSVRHKAFCLGNFFYAFFGCQFVSCAGR